MSGTESQDKPTASLLISAIDVQSSRVCGMLEDAVGALYAEDTSAHRSIELRDDEVDAADIRIERDAVRIVTEAFDAGTPLEPATVRLLFTIVKVNNELERIGDLAVSIASRVGSFGDGDDGLPEQIRVVGNSVVGLTRDASRAFVSLDAVAAEGVLRSDDITEACREMILTQSEAAIARGTRTPEFAFALNRVAASLSMAGDHATNIAEQVIYVATGKIVRHQVDTWGTPRDPDGGG